MLLVQRVLVLQAHLKARLIVRNLRFSATADHIRAAFLRYGASPLITHIHVPMAAASAPAAGAASDSDSSDDEEEGTGKGEEGADGKPARKPRNRGFAFVEFVSRAEAEVSLNRMTWTPPAAGAASAASGGATSGGGVVDGPRKIHKREVAVDWVLDKEEAAAAAAAKKLAAEEAAAADAAATTDAARDDDGAVAAADGDDDGSGSDEEDAEAEAEEDESGSDDDADADDAASASASGPVYKSEAVEAGTTLFLRNLPFDATDTDVYTAMKVFGPLRYARVVMDRDMGWSKGEWWWGWQRG